MDFTFSEEQRMLRDSVRRYLAANYDFEARKRAIASEAGWRPEIWQALAQEIGVFGAPMPEEVGGFGGGPVENLVVMEELGRALVVEPYFETVVLAGGVLKRAGGETARSALERIVAGGLVATLAWSEPSSRYDAALVATRAERDGDGFRIDGRKAVVTAAPWSSHLVVSARSRGEGRDADGISLFLVETGAAGVLRRDYPTVDGRRASEIVFEGVRVGPEALLGAEGAGLPILEAALDEGRAALCAEALGVLSELQRQTIEYAKQRRQFGRPIADFQVLQHRMVDMFMRVEQSVSMAYMATLKLGLDPAERARAVSAAKYYVGQACAFVGQNAVQIHGGIGLTEELALSHYFKRATMIEQELGTSDYHLRRFQQAA